MRGKTTPEEQDRASSSERVAILGLRRAGKSTFLAVLSHALIQNRSDWEVNPHRHTQKRMKYLDDRVFRNGLFPDPTVEREKESDTLTFEVKREARLWGMVEGDVFELRADDIPGGPVEGLAGQDETFTNFYEEYVKECAAIIFLIDPQHKWLDNSENQERGKVKEGEAPYLYYFKSILNELVNLRGSDLIVAFCITKLDQEPDGLVYFEDSGDQSPNEYLDRKAAEVLGEEAKRHIDNRLRRNTVRWFGVSATGYYVDADGHKHTQHTRKIDPAKGTEWAAIARPDLLKPLGVAEAAEWVFDQVAARHMRGRGRFRF